jgi:hypothetical protein
VAGGDASKEISGTTGNPLTAGFDSLQVKRMQNISKPVLLLISYLGLAWASTAASAVQPDALSLWQQGALRAAM